MQTEFFSILLSGLQEAINDTWEFKGASRPWLVMYPNGGEIYDPVSRTRQISGGVDKAKTWAGKLGELVDDVVRQHTWGGVMVGGCCRTGPEEIRALSKLLSG
jgi:homocysteine S-methyltransferase